MSDLISRQAVIEELHRYFSEDGFKSDGYWWHSARVMQAIANVPSVESKTGRWKHIKIESDKSDAGYFMLPQCECSVCDLYVEQESNYCPNCGANMKGAV